MRLLQGDFSAVTQYGDPFAQLRAFADAGAEWVHIVDLDGARAGMPAQQQLIAGLAGETGLKVQSGGGVRTREHVETLISSGVARVVIGSVAARDPAAVRNWIAAYGVDRICVALDVRAVGDSWDVAADGWASGAGISLESLLACYPEGGLRHILVTDIARDGALTGPNIGLMRWVRAARPDLALQASGGVSDIDDLRALSDAGASAAIVGRALYEKRFTLEEALAL